MLATYGSRWSAQYPPEVLPVTQEQWLRVLSSYTLADIRRGLDNWKEEWPPSSVFQFEKGCRPQPELTGCAAILHEEQKKLARPKYSKEKARKNIENLKKVIHGTGVIDGIE